jgi:hypothetical protein
MTKKPEISFGLLKKVLDIVDVSLSDYPEIDEHLVILDEPKAEKLKRKPQNYSGYVVSNGVDTFVLAADPHNGVYKHDPYTLMCDGEVDGLYDYVIVAETRKST